MCFARLITEVHTKYTWSLPLITVRWENVHSSVGRNKGGGYKKSSFINYELKCN